MVGVTGFEPAASCSQSKRATNCATPRKKVFTVCLRHLIIIHYRPVFVKRNHALRTNTFVAILLNRHFSAVKARKKRIFTVLFIVRENMKRGE